MGADGRDPGVEDGGCAGHHAQAGQGGCPADGTGDGQGPGGAGPDDSTSGRADGVAVQAADGDVCARIGRVSARGVEQC